ncbi:MAG: arginine repressor [Phycisphaerales bacterium JB037]
MTDRQRRQALICRILAGGPIASQEALVARLASVGVHTTQATLSRDLRDLGVLKGPDGYILPEATAEPARALPRVPEPDLRYDSLARVVSQYLVSVAGGVGQVVIHTNPGHAQLIALELDRFPPKGVLGTIAGDDTIFVAVASPERVASFVEELEEMAGLSHYRDMDGGDLDEQDLDQSDLEGASS